MNVEFKSARALNALLKASNPKDSREHLRYVHLYPDGTAWGSDGHIMARTSFTLGDGEALEAPIYFRLAKAMPGKWLKDDEPVTVFFDGNPGFAASYGANHDMVAVARPGPNEPMLDMLALFQRVDVGLSPPVREPYGTFAFDVSIIGRVYPYPAMFDVFAENRPVKVTDAFDPEKLVITLMPIMIRGGAA
jgi:hypothetical protein